MAKKRVKRATGSRRAAKAPSTPSNTARIFVPPPEALLARSLAFTLAAITWYIANSEDLRRCVKTSVKCDCRIEHGYNSSAKAEYIEITCNQGCNIDTSTPSMWGMNASSLTSSSWDNITLSYDESSQNCVWKAGGFIMGKRTRAAQDRVITNPLRYFYARGYASEANQNEQAGRTPKPRKGFIDVSLGDLAPFIYALDALRERTVYPRNREARAKAKRMLNVLLGDLGDADLSLHEAVYVLFQPRLDNQCKIDVRSIVYRVPGLGRQVEFVQYFGDVVGWTYRLLVIEVLHSVSEESIELLPRWPSIVIVNYPEDTRFMETTVVSGEDLLLAYQSVASAADELGLTLHRLLTMLRLLPGCIIDAASHGVLNESGARAVAAQLTPLYDFILQGSVDRDIFYSVIRNLTSVNGITRVDTCARVLRSAGGG
ncbi:hypothetical protein Pyrfu_0507 [Pyrolobus fumarii 1A]|uniref:Uncharacterized protein n=1 Tax=Pyrolobus fumarii (strain DSM 11204 / 1A) TaxID=694429 RepID=G0EGK4_PYRF1|nr:hypothetical protein [Pyrolobus fumarii]AEM38378.1 hypothetical protein Pyrfu_0507 [Pyrolobus fumarii 1A]